MTGGSKKIVVAMSGGVDSSVAAALLKEQGHEVVGVSLRMWEAEGLGPRNCTDLGGARAVAKLLGIPHELLDLRAEFVERVVEPFAREYLRGRTPNPCVSCNRDFKLGKLLDWALGRGADYVATGHYARIAADERTGRRALLRGADRSKDQSYFLFALSREQLDRTLFPVGELSKSEVRREARRLGLPVADRVESQDICFGDYRALVRSYASEGELAGGEIVDEAGRVLGRHQGIHGVTVGQRRGLGLCASRPLYVLGIEEATRRIVVGGKEALACRGLLARDVRWIDTPPEEPIEAEVQIRYRSPPAPCTVRRRSDGSWQVSFRRPHAPVTPGQAAVFYRGDRVLGGGWIEAALRAQPSAGRPAHV
ncbi:MAG TPA: tRNA 2-thiouridine(34) synthase MnmA [candidate division Zixibacteria bacterium]|nr:tRNA 2-thiouridine(34) synthase MnmA [candidate division Zixibacteria bacterium]